MSEKQTSSRVTDAMVDRFLSWRFDVLGSNVTGISLLTAVEARAMLEQVLGDDDVSDSKSQPATEPHDPAEFFTEYFNKQLIASSPRVVVMKAFNPGDLIIIEVTDTLLALSEESFTRMRNMVKYCEEKLGVKMLLLTPGLRVAGRQETEIVGRQETESATPEEDNPLMKRSYVMSQPHLSGYRLILGFETQQQVSEAYEYVAIISRPKHEATST